MRAAPHRVSRPGQRTCRRPGSAGPKRRCRSGSEFAVTRSTAPSPSTSAAVTHYGLTPHRVSHLGGERAVAQVPQDRNGVGAVVRRDQVHVPVAVHVGRRHALRTDPHRVSDPGRERAVAQVPQDRYGVGAVVRRDQVHVAVPVDVGRRHADRGPSPPRKSTWAANVPSPRFRRTDTVSESLFAVTRSTWPVAVHVGRRHAARTNSPPRNRPAPRTCRRPGSAGPRRCWSRRSP